MHETAWAQPRVPDQRAGGSSRLGRLRGRVRSLPGGAVMWRIGITLCGLALFAVGIVLLPLPLPGPGWLIIFAGLGLLATEYEWAARLLRHARRMMTNWTAWTARQGLATRVCVGVLGLLVLAAALAGSWFLYTIL